MLDRAKRVRLWKRTWIGAAMVAGLALVLWLGSREGGEHAILWTGVALAACAAIELARMGALVEGRRPVFTWLALAGTTLWMERTAQWPLASPAHAWSLAAQTLLWTVACAALGALLRRRALRERWGSARGPWFAIGLCAWIALPLPWTALVRSVWGPAAFAALVLLSKIGDMAALYVGSALGRTHPFPRISPGKTTAGCVGSFFAAVLGGALLQGVGWLPEPRAGLVTGLLAGACINLAAQAGDLFKSLVKRLSGVKDSGRLFGPAGGVLDMVDSLLFSVPCALLTWPFLFSPD